jgi:hypothetical protein
VRGPVCQDSPSAGAAALKLAIDSASPNPAAPELEGAASAAERVLAAELQNRGEENGALSMMMNSMLRMVQAGQSSQSRWQDS